MSRILYLTQDYTPHDARFLQKLAATSHEVWFLPCKPMSNRWKSHPLPNRVQALASLSDSAQSWTFYNWIVAYFRLRQRLRDVRPHLLHAGPVQEGGFLAALQRFHPLLVMSWGSDLLVRADQTFWMRQKTRYPLRQADMFFGDCLAVRDKALEFAPLKPEQIVLFPWGVDLSHFKPQPSTLRLRETLKWETNPIFIYTRGFEPIHAPLVFLNAFAQVLTRFPNARALLLGTGSLESTVRSFSHQHNLDGHLHFAGQVPPELLPHYFNESDVYVSSTLSDGSSISLLEAMACGKPAIVVDAFGNREWIQPGENGWRYAPGDAASLAKALSEALENEERRKAMGLRNRELVQKKADWNQNFNLLLKAYDHLLEAAS